jgi:O-methyltransferase
MEGSFGVRRPQGKSMALSIAQAMYADLLKRILTNWIYADAEYLTVSPDRTTLSGRVKHVVTNKLASKGLSLVKPVPASEWKTRDKDRSDGIDHPPFAHAMTGIRRLDNLQECLERVIAADVPGDFIETGVWRGGASIFMRGLLKVMDITDRNVWVADSFEGLPPPDPQRYPADAGATWHQNTSLAVSLEQVKRNFDRYGLLDDQVKFAKGWFKDTLPMLQTNAFALIRLDGDMYESTMDALTNLYPKLSVGGFAIIDDYGCVSACEEAVRTYRAQHGIEDPIETIDWTGAFWRKSK